MESKLSRCLSHEYDFHFQFSYLNWQASSTFIENNVTKVLDVVKASSKVDNIFSCQEIPIDIMELVIYEDRFFFKFEIGQSTCIQLCNINIVFAFEFYCLFCQFVCSFIASCTNICCQPFMNTNLIQLGYFMQKRSDHAYKHGSSFPKQPGEFCLSHREVRIPSAYSDAVGGL